MMSEQDLEAGRRRMVETQIRGRGIDDPEVLRAFLKVPRHEFVNPDFWDRAYADSPLPISEGQTISQPYMVAAMTAAARIKPADRILEVGTGSGYQAAILAELGAQVYTTERIPELSRRACTIISNLGYTNVRFRVSNGTLGWPEEAPFDVILVTAGAPKIPAPLEEQLGEGGRLVIPVENGFGQILYTITREKGVLQRRRGERCSFVPLIGEHGWKG